MTLFQVSEGGGGGEQPLFPAPRNTLGGGNSQTQVVGTSGGQHHDVTIDAKGAKSGGLPSFLIIPHIFPNDRTQPGQMLGGGREEKGSRRGRRLDVGSQ